jgi:hypothetical protein
MIPDLTEGRRRAGDAVHAVADRSPAPVAATSGARDRGSSA